MKVKVKDLVPNHHRGWEEFQLDRVTVDMLKNSIQETFFWENVIGRVVNGKVEIAYGHHRLQALRELYPNGNKMFNVSVYPLDDEKMFIIMARENETGKNLTIPNIDLTVKKAKEFLEANPEVHRKYSEKVHKVAGFVAISRFLKWNITRVKIASERLDGYEDKGGTTPLLDRQAVESLPSERTSQDFVRAVKSTQASRKTQRKVAEKIVKSRAKEHTEEGAIIGKYRIEAEMHKEEYGDEEKAREERRKLEEKERRQQFENYLTQVKDKTDSLRRTLTDLLPFQDVLLSPHYHKSEEGQAFVYAMAELFNTFRILMGTDKADLVESFKLLVSKKEAKK